MYQMYRKCTKICQLDTYANIYQNICKIFKKILAYHRFIKIVQCTDFNLSESSYFIVLRIVINFLKH